MPYRAYPVFEIIKSLKEYEIVYFMEALPREVIANCDKAKKRPRSETPALKIASLKSHLCQYLAGEGPYIGGTAAERSTEEYEKAVEKANREGLDPDTSYDGFSRFSSTFADLLADMLRVHREREYRSRQYEREKAVEFFAHFFEDYRIESAAILDRRMETLFTDLQRFSSALGPTLPLPPVRVRNTPVENTGYFFDTLGFKNAGNGDFSAFRKRFRVRRALIALRAVFYFQLMYKKSIEAQFHPDKVRERLEDEFREMGEEVRGE